MLSHDEALRAGYTQPRNFQIPGCFVEITTDEAGISVEELLAIAFGLAHSNPGAIVDVGIRVRAADDS